MRGLDAGLGRGKGLLLLLVGSDARACRDGLSPLVFASMNGHVSCVEALIGAKADVLQYDE